MPLVLLQCQNRNGLDEIAYRLAENLPSIISSALDVPENQEARLTPEDIEIRFTWTTARHKNAKDIEIVVIAHDYPERTANIEARKNAILNGVRTFLAVYTYDRKVKVTGWVWVLPQQNSAFGKI